LLVCVNLATEVCVVRPSRLHMFDRNIEILRNGTNVTTCLPYLCDDLSDEEPCSVDTRLAPASTTDPKGNQRVTECADRFVE
jgi:hypothetical protein